MDRILPNDARGLVVLSVLACLLLASCQDRFDAEDKAFARAEQQQLAAEFKSQIAMLTTAEKQLPVPAAKPVKIPAGFSPPWNKAVAGTLFVGAKPARHSLEDLFARTLKHSKQIKVFSDLPLIRETGIREARGRFDTHAFVETFYSLTNEPVGSTLKTGGPSRFHEYQTSLEAGIKKKLITGADLKFSQWLARTTSNSVFFVPHRQATARLALMITQPLLKGAGVKYNRSFIRIAKIDSQVARSEFVRQAEAHLLEVNRAYWSLYLARALCVQKRKLVADTAALVDKLAKRTDIDTMQSQLKRARSALASRQAELVRAEMAVKNAEDRIKALINDPDLLPSGKVELVPTDMPSMAELKVDMKQAAAVALENRPEIRQAFMQFKAAMIRRDMAKNEVLPKLDLVLEAAISGLDNAGPITAAYDDQWRHPGFRIGLVFDYPVENNTAEARLLRRKLELRQQLSQLRTTVDTVLLEVKIAAREVVTRYHEMQARYQALRAAEEDVRILAKRWEPFAGADGRGTMGYLRLLIDAQERLAQAQQDLAASTASYNVALVNLQRAQGTLLSYQDLKITRTKDKDDLPVLNLEKKKKP
ncbi:MAG: hypothetical protein B1H04_03265 [Planctomycetales bacterium 4484_123]|nr:MAG: hypothetical protein B1H04_03265 [Planctomycetales bacterium 4484_123]